MIRILPIIGIIKLLILSSLFASSLEANDKVVIAHRGASGYLPEHSLSSKAMAYAMEADYIEQDLVMTQDNKVVVLHDIYLDRVTNVAEKFPGRNRKDGRYYIVDFTLSEIRQLAMTERFGNQKGDYAPQFPQRFPLWKSSFRVHTFEEEIELIQGLNKSTGKSIGIYPEIKSPGFHRHEGKDISKAILLILNKYGYTTKNDLIYLQCFDPNELKRIRQDLLPAFNMEIKLIQLIAKTEWKTTMVYQEGKTIPYDYDWMFSSGGMQTVAQYADGIGPWMSMIIKNNSTRDSLLITSLVRDAHDAGLLVHPYTFRADEGSMPGYVSSFGELLDIFYYRVGVDGIFTDFPDRAVDFLERAKSSK